jgi:predicted site-specific integrase-resolvase
MQVGEGEIKAIRTAGGKHRIPESEIRRIAESLPISKESSYLCSC